MKKLIFLLIIICAFTLPVLAQTTKKVSVTEEEKNSLLQAYSQRQQAQQKLSEQKKQAEAIKQILDAGIKQAETDDANAYMLIRTVELQIGNNHGFKPDEYEKTEIEGKLVYVEKPKKEKEAEKPKEGK